MSQDAELDFYIDFLMPNLIIQRFVYGKINEF